MTSLTAGCVPTPTKLLLSVVQAPTELAIATKFAQMLRNGDIGGMKFNKTVGIGHSYGAIQTLALSATQPDLLDAVLLQGFSVDLYVAL